MNVGATEAERRETQDPLDFRRGRRNLFHFFKPERWAYAKKKLSVIAVAMIILCPKYKTSALISLITW